MSFLAQQLKTPIHRFLFGLPSQTHWLNGLWTVEDYTGVQKSQEGHPLIWQYQCIMWMCNLWLHQLFYHTVIPVYLCALHLQLSKQRYWYLFNLKDQLVATSAATILFFMDDEKILETFAPEPTSRPENHPFEKEKQWTTDSIFVFGVQVFDHKHVPSTSSLCVFAFQNSPCDDGTLQLFTFSGPLPPTCPTWRTWNLIQCRCQSAKAPRVDTVGASQIWMMERRL